MVDIPRDVARPDLRSSNPPMTHANFSIHPTSPTLPLAATTAVGTATKPRTWAAVAALGALFTAACSAPSASVSPLLGALKLDGSFAANDGPVAVSTDFNDLGLTDTEASPGLKAQVDVLGAQFSVSGFKTGYEGSGMTTGEISIGSEVIAANTAVDSELDLIVARALFTWNLIPVGPVELGIGLGLSVIDFDLKMREQISGAQLDSNQVLPIPLIALRAAWNWGPVKVRAEAGGLKINIDGDSAEVIDGDIEASVRLFEGGALLVGYRVFDIKAEYEDEGDKAEADFNLAGYYLGVRFSF